MTTIEKQCRALWFKSIHTRDKCCQICGNTSDVHAHHLFHKANWLLALDVDYGACFCTEHHNQFHGTKEERDDAFDQFINRLSCVDFRRATKIIKQQNRPEPPPSTPCWPNVLLWVKDQHKKIANDVAWNQDCEPTYGKNVI